MYDYAFTCIIIYVRMDVHNYVGFVHTYAELS